MSCRIRAVEHRCTADAHPGWQDRILLNYTTGLPTVFTKKPDLVPKKPESPDSSSKA